MKTLFRISLLIIPVIFGSLASQAQEVLTLYGAIEAGLKNNFSIIIRQNDARITSNNNTAGNAGFLPTIALTATQNNTITNTHQETFSDSIRDIGSAANNTLNAGIQLNWTLFDGFSMFTNKAMLETLEEMGETEVRATIENTLYAVVVGYYGVLQQQQLIKVHEDAVALSMERKKIMQAKTSLGSGSRLMLLQSTVDLNADSINLIREQSLLKQYMADLNRLLARVPETPFIIADSITLNQPLPYDTLLSKARILNNNLELARGNLDLATLSLKGAQSYRYPRLNLQTAYTFNELNAETGFLKNNRSYGPSFGFSLAYPLFDGNNISRNIRNAAIGINTSEYLLKQTDLDIHTEIYKAYTDYRSNLRMVEMEAINREVAKENVEIAFEKYRLGAINDIELRETQKKYIDSQYELLMAQFLAKKAETNLLQLSGQLINMAYR